MAERMKDSGIAWIGKIPEEWEVTKIKHLFRERIELNNNKEAVLLSLFASIGVRPRSEMEEKGNKAQTVIGYSIVKNGDIVVNKLLAWMGAIGLSKYDGVTSPDYDVYTPISNCISVSYYHNLFRSVNFKEECKKYSRGIMDMRLRTYPHEFKNIIVPLPSETEQTAIASFLDKECTLIDSITHDIERQIEILKQYKQSLITEAVTKGLDKNVKMKSTGVKLIGDIPENWKLQRFKYCGGVYYGFPFDSNYFTNDNQKMPLIRIRDITSGEISTYYSSSYPKMSIVHHGDILVGMDGDFNVCRWKNNDAILNQRCCKINTSDKVLSEYLYYYLPFQLRELNNSIWSTTVKHLLSTHIDNLLIAYPSIEEQKSIAEYLDDRCSKIDAVISDKQTQLDTLKKHKQSLIYEYVTGKKRVTTAAAA